MKWSLETMAAINKLTPEIKGKATDPDWFLLRQRLEQVDEIMNANRQLKAALDLYEKSDCLVNNQPAVKALITVLQSVREEFDGRYDGAPDSGMQWMGSLMHDIDEALQKAGCL